MPSSYTPQQKGLIAQFVGFTSVKDSVAAKVIPDLSHLVLTCSLPGCSYYNLHLLVASANVVLLSSLGKNDWLTGCPMSRPSKLMDGMSKRQ